jgi:poly-beta-1,6-N-acetyl-D-glucosamine synthase
MPPVRFAIVSPVRNEEPFLPATVRSVIGQTIRPFRWIIVDDGSADQTGAIAEQAARDQPWIQVVRRKDRGFRKSGAGVMDAFYDGFRLLDREDWQFVVKLDGDLDFEPDFFQLVFEAFAADSKLGISGGDIYHRENGKVVIESRDDPTFHVRGATKVYSRPCWDAIGGLFQVTGWDTLDEVKANMLGWTTRRIPGARALHLRPTGGADGGWRNAFKNGRGSYICGYHPLYMLSKCIRRLPSKPFVVQSLGLFAGFFGSYIGGARQIDDRPLVRYLRKQQLRRLLGLPSVWS